MPKARLTIGLIGAGMIGQVHLERVHRDGRARVIWVADPSPATLADVAKRFSVPGTVRDYRVVLADPKVDAVIIATPPSSHASIAIAALRAGKHVLLEKPMVHCRSDLRRLVTEAAKHPNLVLLDCSCRHSRLQPKFEFIKRIVRSGALGDVYRIHHQHLVRTTFLDYNPKGVWARKKTLAGGGPVLDWGVYDLAFLLGILDDAPNLVGVKAFAQGGLQMARDRRNASDVEEHAAAWMDFSEGLSFYYERGAGVHFESANESRIFGTKGGLRFSYPSWESKVVEVFAVDRQGRTKTVERAVRIPRHHDDNLALTRHFLDCILKGTAPLMPIELAAKHLDILLKIFAAAER